VLIAYVDEDYTFESGRSPWFQITISGMLYPASANNRYAIKKYRDDPDKLLKSLEHFDSEVFRDLPEMDLVEVANAKN
jgi:hypothetical protein